MDRDDHSTCAIGHVFCLLHTGNQPDWKTRYSSELFATKVMPHLRDLWPDYEDDDRWWIHPLEGRVDPTAGLARVRPASVPERAAMTRHRTGCGPPGARRARQTYGDPAGRPLVLLHGAAGPARRRRLPRSRWPTPATVVLAPELPGLRLLDRRGAPRGHARLHAARLGRGRRPRARPSPSHRPLDGRDDRRRDGRRLPVRPEALVLVAPNGLVGRRRPGRRPVQPAAVPVRRVALRRPGGRRGAAHRRAWTSTTWRPSPISSSATPAGSAPPARSCSRSPTAACRSASTG